MKILKQTNEELVLINKDWLVLFVGLIILVVNSMVLLQQNLVLKQIILLIIFLFVGLLVMLKAEFSKTIFNKKAGTITKRYLFKKNIDQIALSSVSEVRYEEYQNGVDAQRRPSIMKQIILIVNGEPVPITKPSTGTKVNGLEVSNSQKKIAEEISSFLGVPLS